MLVGDGILKKRTGITYFRGFFRDGAPFMDMVDAKVMFSGWRRITLESKNSPKLMRKSWNGWIRQAKKQKRNRSMFEDSPKFHVFIGTDTFVDILPITDG